VAWLAHDGTAPPETVGLDPGKERDLVEGWESWIRG
jgi:hypothetical protein